MVPDSPPLELTGVSKYYRNFQALDDITVSVAPGAIGLLGPNGAGKSTLIKTLLGLLRLTSGEARVLGLDVKTQSRLIREQVGYMPEDDCAIAGVKGVESVAFAGELAGLPGLTALRRAHEILDYVGLDEARYREVQTYSTGMRQRIKLAQALIHSPKLLFLDEPTSGLDPVGREKMLRLIRNLAHKKGVSVIVSTHILTDIEMSCDAALIIGRGRLLVYDTIENLQRSVDTGCLVRFDGDAKMFGRELAERGCRVESIAAEEMRIQMPAHSDNKPILQAAQAARASVRQILASRNSLEDRFLEAVRATEEPAVKASETP